MYHTYVKDKERKMNINIIPGKKIKEDMKDFSHICYECSKLFHFNSNCVGKDIVCPHCGHILHN